LRLRLCLRLRSLLCKLQHLLHLHLLLRLHASVVELGLKVLPRVGHPM
jgi:hypothetical protein